MIYTFTDCFFSSLGESEIKILDRLWHNSKDRHQLYLKNLESIKSTTWYQELRPSYKKEIETLYIASAQVPKKSNKITISSITSEDCYSLIEAEAVLTTPFKIIFENIEYDAYFLESIIHCYPRLGQKIIEHKKNGWLEYCNGGGENIANVLVSLKERFESQKSEFPKDSYRYVRGFVLLDSDKQYPNDSTEKSLHTIVKQSGLAYWILQKREKENYLPIEVFEEIEKNDDFIKSIKRLKPPQLDYFDLEKGFPDKNFTQLDPEIQNLYVLISEEDKNIFRKNKLTFYKIDEKKDSFKARFSKLFSSNMVTTESMERRASSTNKDELRQIIEKINELL